MDKNLWLNLLFICVFYGSPVWMIIIWLNLKEIGAIVLFILRPFWLVYEIVRLVIALIDFLIRRKVFNWKY